MNSIGSHTDLISGIKKSDAHSFELLFRRLYPQLCAFANKFINDMDESEEIVQEVFFKIWKNRDQLDEKKTIDGYLFTSVKNGCFNLLEHQKVHSKYANLLYHLYKSTSGEEFSAHESFIADELEQDLDKALQQLSPQCRTIFELSRFEGLKYREIAERLNISIKTVETQMFRALQKIRHQLKEYLAIIILFHFFK